MDRSEKIDNLAKALADAQANLPAAKADGTNPFYNSKYATLESVFKTARPVLAAFGLAISQLITSDELDRVGVETILMHQSGEFISNTCFVKLTPLDGEPEVDNYGKKKAKPQPIQEAGKTINYLRRYGLESILGIYEEETPAQQTKPVQGTAQPRPVSTGTVAKPATSTGKSY